MSNALTISDNKITYNTFKRFITCNYFKRIL